MKATLLLSTLLAVAGPATSLSGQSLAEVAKKNDERRAKSTDEAPAKVYTNKDLAAASSPVAADKESASVVVGTDSKTTTKVEATTTIKDEDWWRSHALPLRRTLADDITKLTAAQAYYDGLPPQAKGVLGTPIVEAWMKAKEDISRLTAIVVNDKRALADFEEEARRAGVPPGWLREK